jgi:predicted secreted protein
MNSLTFASQHQMIDTLGSSAKGQFVALEEYGYEPQKHAYYVKIKIINVWKNVYVGEGFEVEAPAKSPIFLEKAREKARLLAQDELGKFGISS